MNQPVRVPVPACTATAAPDLPPAPRLPPEVVATPVAKAPPTLLFAVASGVLITDVTATQPLIGPMGQSLLLPEGAASLIATLALLGYAAGLFFIVPLADRMEARRLAVLMLVAGIAARLGLALAPSGASAFAAAFAVGVGSSAVQVLVPLAAAMAPEEMRGRVVGNVMAGVMAGILLARPLAGVIADLLGWRAFFLVTAAVTTLLSVVLALRLPHHPPRTGTSYPALIRSMVTLVLEEKVLRRRAFSAALCMAAFSAFWTVVALRLAAAPFSLSQSGIAIFALAGCGTVIIAPIAGRAGDRGFTKAGTHVAHMVMLAACGVAYLGGLLADAGGLILPLVLLAVAGLMLDMGAVGDQTLGRRAINLIRPEARSRVNGLFSGIFFVGGAVGAAAGGSAYALAGWSGNCLLMAGIVVVLSLAGLAEPRSRRVEIPVPAE